ncbi:MAG TPA: metalloregulator ArsR/SmtB family transcription factor [Aliidongia sp.]|uniref:helix-turn-helix transcriptional regulator n=1 Tax=Aliidongia sp. TaxID=1914230 RepID=UPI002DDCC10A|nr:metalloregulator ArsR/SmtB family transcription factor [Aliidongia sp.]HEV2675863.1 metalloregulator ArsR/SmtB family transcription factor [Aliidongia sp.]
MTNDLPDRTSDRLLHALKATGPQTAATLAARLAVTAVAIRQHLDRLAAGGLVAFEDRREAVGRPKRHWRLSDAGHRRFPENHAGLTLELISAVSAVFGDAGLDQLIDHREVQTLATYRARLAGAGSLGEKLAILAETRTAEGYMAEVSAVEDGSFMLIENHCPICIAATRCQNLCRSELRVFAAALGDAAEIVRIDHIPAGARRCAYRVRPQSRN